MSTEIKDIKLRKVLDSRGNFTIEAEVILKNCSAIASAPSGASRGKHEVVAFAENSAELSIERAEKKVIPELKGMRADEQEAIDNALKEADGTENFSFLGGNLASAISLACAKASAKSHGLKLYEYIRETQKIKEEPCLPFPLGNVVGGGKHAINSTDIQEFLLLPVGARNIIQAVEANAGLHKNVAKALAEKNLLAGKGDEGAWIARASSEEVLDILSREVEKHEKESGIKVKLGLDIAASELWNSKAREYIYKNEGKEKTREEQINYVKELIEKYNLAYVEDALEEEDFAGFAEITEACGKNCLICGDDLYTTNIKRIKHGIEKKSTNAVLIKFNQIGTLSDTYEAIKLAKKSNLAPVISHRSGETEENAIAHIAVAFAAPIIKTGIVGGERIAKLNELIRIGEENINMAKLDKVIER